MVRFGVIGTNWITERFLDAARQVEDFQLTAVFSRTEKRAAEFASKYNAPHTFTSIQEMADSDQLDAVYIASPNSLHKEYAIALMNGKKHVLCEKPMGSNVREVEEMIQAARDNQVLLMEALKSSFLPNFKAVQENLHKVGQIRRYIGNYCQYSSRYDKYKEGTVLNAFKPEFSNGSLMDIGVYGIYPMVVLFGEPEEVKANGVMLESGVDGQGTVLVKYGDMEGIVMHSKITNSEMPSEIQGEKGSLIIDPIHRAERVIFRDHHGNEEDLSVPQNENSMYDETKEFISLIKENKRESDINTFETSVTVARIIEEARKQVGVVFPADQK
ncbi:Gfo/Idh/MocA family oxidoreductase [Virgibacillus sp. MSP4-1]|uniref:Gfo/Idh/MocA family protein n=1 Tax=Virgibacillus sp. MSP4-1 TaxID=2700081 RepID=UPI00039B56F3|nr:Gfo/Idh/MocA family oxidoreductase [Virgibacillus sp. MSP4-1]QHS24223.1 Gfo/Idh/MocA family oxidoreductase [Virgibacillus sp. MSP4-1]